MMPLHILWQVMNDCPQDAIAWTPFSPFSVYQSIPVNQTGIISLRLRKNSLENCLIFTTVMRAMGECLSAHLQCIRYFWWVRIVRKKNPLLSFDHTEQE